MTDDARPELNSAEREPANTASDPAWPESPGSPSVVPPTGASIVGASRRPVLRATWEWAKSISLAIILFLVVRAFLVEAFKIPSGSMEGTLLVGDFLLVNKLVYGAEVPILRKQLPAVRNPRLGDVIVFQWPEDPAKSFVKRLVGLPHDTVEMRLGVLFRNGLRQMEPYAVHSAVGSDLPSEEFRWQRDFLTTPVDSRRYHPSRNNWGPLVVPSDHYFVLGDNRDNSSDSRYWGFLPDTLVRGTPILVYYSYAPDSGDAFDWLKRVRWQRLGELIH